MRTINAHASYDDNIHTLDVLVEKHRKALDEAEHSYIHVLILRDEIRRAEQEITHNVYYNPY